MEARLCNGVKKTQRDTHASVDVAAGHIRNARAKRDEEKKGEGKGVRRMPAVLSDDAKAIRDRLGSRWSERLSRIRTGAERRHHPRGRRRGQQ